MKPTDNELEMAIIAAERMRETGEDEHHIARSLLYLYQRLQDLENVLDAAESYLDFDQEEPQHAELVLAIKAASDAEERQLGETRETTGLE
ncbi:MAG: hypothetical protein ABFS22_08955 [Pseudomonadota bacterium]